MRKEYTYKLQGDGSDSWEVREYDENNELINIYMVYKDPNAIGGTALEALKNATFEDLLEIKRILDNI
jgi:hypothetical protein